jgi:hypothetical protein
MKLDNAAIDEKAKQAIGEFIKERERVTVLEILDHFGVNVLLPNRRRATRVLRMLGWYMRRTSYARGANCSLSNVWFPGPEPISDSMGFMRVLEQRKAEKASGSNGEQIAAVPPDCSIRVRNI